MKSRGTHFLLDSVCLMTIKADSTTSASLGSPLASPSAPLLPLSPLSLIGRFFALAFAFPRMNLLQVLSSCNEGKPGIEVISKRFVLMCKLAHSPKFCIISPSWLALASTESAFSICLECFNSRVDVKVTLAYFATVWNPSSSTLLGIAGSAKHSSNLSAAWVGVHPHFLGRRRICLSYMQCNATVSAISL